MQVNSDKDFADLRIHISGWYTKFSIYKRDIYEIENIIEKYIKNYSLSMISYRQTKQKKFLKNAEDHLNNINRVISMANKMMLMSLLVQT